MICMAGRSNSRGAPAAARGRRGHRWGRTPGASQQRLYIDIQYAGQVEQYRESVHGAEAPLNLDSQLSDLPTSPASVAWLSPWRRRRAIRSPEEPVTMASPSSQQKLVDSSWDTRTPAPCRPCNTRAAGPGED